MTVATKPSNSLSKAVNEKSRFYVEILVKAASFLFAFA